MKFTISRTIALLSFSLLGQSVYGQTVSYPVVSRDGLQPGFYRPHSWVASPVSSVNLAHGPGQTVCNTTNPCYYNPADLWTAYATSTFQAKHNYGQGITVAIVDAYYNPQTQADLVGFSTFYSLPLGTNPSAITCPTTPAFNIVSQTGGAPTAAFNPDWALETDLDVQWVHAMAPCANILVVTTTDNGGTLFDGVQYAYGHADVVTNSWGGSESTDQSSLDSMYLSGTTVPVLFSSGDTPAVVQYPCSSPYSTCVGGTTLVTTASAFRSAESAWFEPTSPTSGAGGGCSTQEAVPAYQSAGFTAGPCGTLRGVPDIAALADPFSGVPLYLGTNQVSSAGVYCCIGGTSLASPLMAGLIANVDSARLAVSKTRLNSNLNQYLYQAAGYTPAGASVQPAPYGNSYRSLFFDVFTGNTGFAATTFWDRTTGLGVPLSPALANYLVTVVP